MIYSHDRIDVRRFRNKWYYGVKDNFFCIFIGLDLHSYTKFPVIRENNFTLLTFLLEKFGSSTISHLFRKRLLLSKYFKRRLGCTYWWYTIVTQGYNLSTLKYASICKNILHNYISAMDIPFNSWKCTYLVVNILSTQSKLVRTSTMFGGVLGQKDFQSNWHEGKYNLRLIMTFPD